MISAGRLMTKNVICVKPETPVMEATRLLVKHKVSGLPVVDEEMNLLGIISEKDMLRLLVEENIESKTVFDFMTKKVISFKDSDSILDICDFLIRNNIRRVPIAKDGKLVGIISRHDILTEIVRLRSLMEHKPQSV